MGKAQEAEDETDRKHFMVCVWWICERPDVAVCRIDMVYNRDRDSVWAVVF